MTKTLTLFSADDGIHGRELWVSDGTPGGTALLKDISAGRCGSYPSGFVDLGRGRAVFGADDGVHGMEPWITDGTAAGTRLLKDIMAGAFGSEVNYFGFTPLGDGRALFRASDGVNGAELWVTDGTEAGTRMLKDINPGKNGAYVTGLTRLGKGKAVFAAEDSNYNSAFYVTDGTEAGTHRVWDISDGFPYAFGTMGNGRALFYTTTQDFADTIVQIWTTDGTKAGTSVLLSYRTDRYFSFEPAFVAMGNGKALLGVPDYDGHYGTWVTNGTAAGTNRASGAITDAAPDPLGGVALGNGKVLFAGWDSTHGANPWITDGTAAGTKLVKDISPATTWYKPSTFAALGNGRALFTDPTVQGDELWISDGTEGGTRKLLTIPDGSISPTIAGITATGGGKAVFSARDGSNGVQPWITDGTAAGTVPLANVNPTTAGLSSFVITATGAGKAVFFANGGDYGVSEMWATDGTAAGTILLGEVMLRTAVANLGNGKAVFGAYQGDSGEEPWVTDGTAAGTFRLKDIYAGRTGSNPQNVFELGNGKAVFSAIFSDRAELWITDGTAAGTALVASFLDSEPGYHTQPQDFRALGNGEAVFRIGSDQLWCTDGTVAGTSPFLTIGGGLYTLDFTALGNGKGVFNGGDGVHGEEPWVTDGTAAGTAMLKDIAPGVPSSKPQGFAALGNGKAVFRTANGYRDFQLWATDGTAAGTVPLKDIADNTGWNKIPNLALLGNGKALFTASETNEQSRLSHLWVTDGTAAGTTLLRDVKSGWYGGFDKVTALGDGRALFVVDETGYFSEVWVTDGTVGGTMRVWDMHPGPLRSYPDPDHFTPLSAGRALFTADDGVHGVELWVTDGTAAGTTLVRDIDKGQGTSNPWSFAALGDGRAMFTADDGETGREPWVTDGTAAGTMRVKDIDTARVGSQPWDFAPLTVAATPEITAIRTADGRPVTGGLAGAGRLTVAGTTTETAGTVQVYDGAALVASAPLTGGADWSVAPAAPLRDGLHALTATVSAGGLTSAASDPAAVTVITGPPEVTVTRVTPDGGLLPDDRVVTTGAVSLDGTAEPGCSLDLFEGTALLGHATASLEGTWSITPATLGAGTHAFVVRATDAAGNTADAQATVSVQPPPVLHSQRLTLTVAEGGTLDLAPLLLANGVGTGLTFASATGASRGVLEFDAARQALAYRATGADAAHPSETIAYTLRDSQGSTVAGTVAVATTGPAMPTDTSREAGATVVAVASGHRLIAGAAGQTLMAGGGGNLFFARADTTVLAGGTGNRIVTLPGNHTILAGAGGATVTLADGSNTVVASGAGNRITGGRGDTVITGPGGTSTVALGDGDQTVVLTGANNTVSVGRGTSTVDGGRGGGERITAAGGDTAVTVGGAGNRVTTGAGRDVITSLGSRAVVDAGSGNDVIRFAGAGSVVTGGRGNDAMDEEGARNRIVLNPAGQGRDDIYGPVLSNGDVLDLRPALAATAWTGTAATLGEYLRIGAAGLDITVAIAPGKGAPVSVVAVLHGTAAPTLDGFAAHALLGPGHAAPG